VSLRRGKPRAELNAEINVVSLIDVMMLLLVIFMITAPMMQGGIEITLPQADGRPLSAKSGIVVTVAQNSVYFNDTELSDRDFRTSFRSLIGTRAKEGVAVQIEATAIAQRWATVLDIIRSAGVENIDFVTAPVEARRR
jgi:biopolymer transport protein ExbD